MVTGNLVKQLGRLSEALRKEVLKEAMKAGAEVIADGARARVPTDTGELRRSIRTTSRASKRTAAASVVVGRKRTDYALATEYGTQTRSPRPFLRPAFDARKAMAVEEIRRKLKAAIMRVARTG